ncbi:sialidase family protein [Flexivirga meconopsidis]|uniref:sialidase family protein n=1 Tax=Flexivirga meconopsidis TaxID=2977121 RepID=UPI00223F3C4E|nr:sialidase family protein [Flexivirga meconopsidis]
MTQRTLLAALTLMALLVSGLLPAASRAEAVPASATTDPNLLSDPGFEQQTSASLGGAWHCVGNCGADLAKGWAHGGSNNAFARYNSGWNSVYQTVTVTPNTTYALTGWLRTSTNSTEGYIGARVPGGGPVRNEDRFAAVGDWQRVSVTIDSGDATSLDVYGGLWASGDTWAQFDDFSLISVGSDQLGAGSNMYPRAIRLQHSGSANGQIIASSSYDAQRVSSIYRSTDDGRTFTKIAAINEPRAPQGVCCASIYELPQAVGDLPEGTLLFAASYGANALPMSLELWASTDHGVTWAKRSTALTATPGGHLWEPELRVNAEGQLTMYYSDETRPGHSQTLMEVFSPDGGRTFGKPYPVVELSDPGARPGMAVVRELKNGTRIMTYEICGSSYGCDVYFRTSSDGADWGNPGAAGTRIVASDGTRFQHTPTITVVDDGSATGKLVLAGQLYVNSTGARDGGNGITLLTNSTGGAGAWHRIVAPVSVPQAANNICDNYSPALVPTAAGRHVLEISTMWAGDTCIARFATGRV